MVDIFDNGTPKYKSPDRIYDGLCGLVQSEEISLLSDIFPDVSWERQGFYYQDNGDRLKSKFEEMMCYGDKMWLMEVAAWQLDQDEVHDLIYLAISNSGFAKRIGLKKLFVEYMLRGDGARYKEIIADYEDELRELNCFDNTGMVKSFVKVMKEYGQTFEFESPYPIYHRFLWQFCDKAKRLDVRNEVMLVAECRTFLSSYDDFIFGLRVNQALYENLEQAHGSRLAKLQSSYKLIEAQLLAIAEKHGLLSEVQADIGLLPSFQSHLLKANETQ